MLSFYVSLKFLLLGCIEQLGLPVSEQGYLLQCPYSFITEKFERIQLIKLNNDKVTGHLKIVHFYQQHGSH